MEKNSFRYQHASLRSTNIAIEHVPFSSLTHPLKWVIFHSKLLVYQRVAAFPGRVPWDFYPARLALLLFTCNDFGPSQIPAEVQKDPQTPRPTRPGWLPGDACWVLRTCRLDEDTNGWNIHIWLSDLVKISIEDEVMFFSSMYSSFNIMFAGCTTAWLRSSWAWVNMCEIQPCWRYDFGGFMDWWVTGYSPDILYHREVHQKNILFQNMYVGKKTPFC